MSSGLSKSRELFVGRENERKAYQRLLTEESPWIMVITGVGGSGKTTLLRYLAEHTPTDVCVVVLDSFFNKSLRTDRLKVLERIAHFVGPSCRPQEVEAFKKFLREKRNQLILRIQMIQNIIAGSDATVAGMTVSMNVADAINEARYQITELATEAFYAQVDTLDAARLVIMLDTCEWLNELEGSDVGQWILNALLPELHTRMLQKGKHCSVIISSRIRLQLQAIDRHDIIDYPLQMLQPTEVYRYLRQKGIDDSELLQNIYKMTHGHADCVSIIGEIWQKQEGNPLSIEVLREKFYDEALERFVKEDVMDERLKPPFREWTRYGVLLRNFNLPLFQKFFCELSEPTIDSFSLFTRYPHVTSIKPYYAFFELLRELQAQEVREQEPDKWKRYHELALSYFAQEPTKAKEWYYHALAYNEEEAKQRALTCDDLEVLKEVARDKTLKLVGVYE